MDTKRRVALVLSLYTFGGELYNGSMECFVGVDEAGRGPLAGPVAVGVLVWKGNSAKNAATYFHTHFKRKTFDSKQISETERGGWYAKICAERAADRLDFCVSFSSARVIDSKGLTRAVNEAMANAPCFFGLKVLTH